MAARTDAELLHALRTGDRAAYAVLWERHLPAARRHAHRLFPSRAEDLVSESFLAIYQQVAEAHSGPQFAFRSYLKAVMRNTAIRWRKEAEQLVDARDVEAADTRDALSIAELDSEAGDVLAALQALPERWQRVLWLAEVAEVGRPEIARQLQIKPNAVSALQRRARTGLKFQWLTRQIPLDLREDRAHVARLLPQYLTEAGNSGLSAEVNLHVASCRDCKVLLHDLRGSTARLQSRSLAGLTTPTASSGYLSPVLAGQATPGNSVAVQLDGVRYAPAVADDGTWSFDTRGLQLPAGDHAFQAWAYSSNAQSPAAGGTFTVLPLEVHGFEGLSGFHDMTVSEAQTTGLVIALQGPANGQVYLSSIEGHTALVSLDANGFARRRLVMNSHGWYYFTIRALDGDGYWGPATEDRVDVYDPAVVFDPWGPSPEDMTFDLIDP